MASVDEVVVATVKGSDVETIVTQIMEAVEKRYPQLNPKYSGYSRSGKKATEQWFWFAEVDRPTKGDNRYEVLARLADGGSGVVVIEAKPSTIAGLGLTDICEKLGYKLAEQKLETKG